MSHRIIAPLIACLVAAGLAAADDLVPPPSRTPARVIVSGLTSTAQDVTVVPVGNHIPRTYTGSLLSNTPGFSWYVSQHYALKTDYPEAKARFYLTLLEMAYPHYVEVFGAEPPGIEETRMAAVYASSEEKWQQAMKSDGVDWRGGGGGVTIAGWRCSYIYPSGTLDYHQRYILLHECTHLFHMCLAGTTYQTPGWYIEGVADAFGSHVYDTKKGQLTVNVLDKATTNNHFDQGVRDWRKSPASFQAYHEKGGASRGIGFLMVHYFADDPDRAQKFRIWRDEMFRIGPGEEAIKATSARLLQELFGPWDAINASFKQWMDARQSTFHYAEWGWEQEANTLWSYGFATEGKLSQTDVYLPPGEKPAYDPLRMDYPAEPMPPIVGPVERGAPEPAVGAVIDFSRCPGRGRAGLGLGLEADEKSKCLCLKLLVEQGKSLTLDGADLGIDKRSVPLPDAFQEAMKAGGHRVGMTVKIAKAAVEVALRAGQGKLAEFDASLPIDAKQRERLLARPLTILARDGWHGVTPFFDDRRRMEPDLSVPAPPNRWRNPGDHLLAALYRAAWRLGKAAPPSLTALRDRMLAAVTQGPEAQKQAAAAFDAQAVALCQAVRQCKAEPQARFGALADLLGLSLRLELASDAAPGHVRMTATLRGPRVGQAEGQLRFAAEPASVLAVVPEPERVALAASQKLVARRVYRLADTAAPFQITAQAKLAWRGEEFALGVDAAGRPSIRGWWIIGPFDNPGGETRDIPHPVEREKIDLAKECPGAGGKPVGWRKVEADPATDVAAENLVNFNTLFGERENAAAYALVWLDAPREMDAVLALGSDDGVVAWLNDERVHTNLVPRGYAPKADRVPIRLREGRNQLLLKVTQGGGGWCFAAHVEERHGGPLSTVFATLDNEAR